MPAPVPPGEIELRRDATPAAFENSRGPSKTLTVDLDGFEGPLALLLALSQRQKVDLTQISMVDLAQQYLDFVRSGPRLDLAADHLVMAAWLTYLKSRLLLPREAPDEPSGEALAAALQHRLLRLDAMRRAAAALTDRPQRGRDVFARGAPEPVEIEVTTRVDGHLFDLLDAYARRYALTERSHVTIRTRPVWTLEEARAALRRLVGSAGDWLPLDALVAALRPETRRGALAASFAAALEMARAGEVELQQEEGFAPILLRSSGARGDGA